MSESFTYDNMNRLKTYQVSGQSLNTVYYSNNGNITSKPDAGSYTYDGIKLNAVTSVTNPAGIISLTSQNITYTGFNKASLITEGTYETQITYGTDNQRIKSVLKNNGNVIKTTYYIPGYEKEVTTGGTRELHYINSPYGLVAIMIKQGGNTSTYFTETDHLGSIIGLINADGSYAEQFSFDPWGRRRNPTNWTYSSVPQPVLITRGFTGHEHLDNFGLIDMNGRMYDPVLGRFLGVDPIIQAADNSQSIDGYGYCLNDPLKYTDPSGYNYRRFLQEYLDSQQEGGSTVFFNNYPGGWEHIQNSLNTGHNGSPSYTYDGGTSTYRDKLGRIVSYNEVYYNYVLPNSHLSHEEIQLGPKKPSLTIDTYDTRIFSLGDFQIIVRVYGKQYSKYNFIQSVKYFGSDTWILDDKSSGIHGFYYDDYWLGIYSDEYYRKGSDAYFEDNPHNEGAQWQMTIGGRRGKIWETITTISWDYSIINGKIDFHYNIVNPAPGHQENVNNTIYYWNHTH